jgi:hypothetical protein
MHNIGHTIFEKREDCKGKLIVKLNQVHGLLLDKLAVTPGHSQPSVIPKD